MKYTKFCRMLQGCLIATGRSASSASVFTYNSVRRTLPTGADIFEMDDADAQAISARQEVPRTGAQRARASQPMCRRYAGTTEAFTGEVKLRLLAHILGGFRRVVKEKGIQPCAAGFYPIQAVTWEDLRAVRARLGPIDQAGSGPEWSVAPTGVQSAAQPAVASPSENSEASDPDDSSSEGSTTSQNESSGSSEEQPRETALHAQTIAWLLQHDRVHIVAEYNASGEAIPHCRTGQGTPFRSEPRRTGHGAVSAIEAGRVCTKCVARVPRATRCAIADA